MIFKKNLLEEGIGALEQAIGSFGRAKYLSLQLKVVIQL